MFKVNNKNNKTTLMTFSGVFIVNFEQFFTPFSSVSIVDFELGIVSWELSFTVVNAEMYVNIYDGDFLWKYLTAFYRLLFLIDIC